MSPGPGTLRHLPSGLWQPSIYIGGRWQYGPADMNRNAERWLKRKPIEQRYR